MMFWSMIEMGTAIVAGCLPTIWPLINNISLEGMVRTIRSVLSLESLCGMSRVSTKSTHQTEGKSDPGENTGPFTQISKFGDKSHFKGSIGVERIVDVQSLPAEGSPALRNLHIPDYGVQTSV
jgi:hypothetical protein